MTRYVHPKSPSSWNSFGLVLQMNGNAILKATFKKKNWLKKESISVNKASKGYLLQCYSAFENSATYPSISNCPV